LNKTLGQKVSIKADVDETLIGGLIVRVGSRMVDSSIRTKLQRLQTAMKGAS
jgi:F-type H+-transporting ATPase subunit delta